MWYKKYKENFLNCLMRKTILQNECCKTMLRLTFCRMFIKNVSKETVVCYTPGIQRQCSYRLCRIPNTRKQVPNTSAIVTGDPQNYHKGVITQELSHLSKGRGSLNPSRKHSDYSLNKQDVTFLVFSYLKKYVNVVQKY